MFFSCIVLQAVINMKKKILISFIFILMAASIFITQFVTTKENEFNNLLTLGDGETPKQIVFSISEQDSREIYHTITHILDKYNGNMYSISVDEDNNFTKYVYCNETKYFENICLSEGRFFESEDKDSLKFLSTYKTNNKNQIGVIKSFEYSRGFEIKTFEGNLNENSFRKIFTLVFENDENFENFRNELKEYEIYFDIIDNDSYEIKYMSFYIIIFVTLYFALIMIFLYDILNSYKEIGIKKMLGFSCFRIWKEKIWSIMKRAVFIFGGSSVVLSLLFFRNFNSIVFVFISRILSLYFLILVLTFIFCSIPFLYVKKIKITNMLKNNRPTNAIICLNTILKILMTIVFLIASLNTYNELGYLNSLHNDKYNNWEKTKNLVTNSEIVYNIGTKEIDSFSEENIEKCYNIYMSLNEKGGILAKFDKYRITENKYKSGVYYRDNNIVINPNYLKNNFIRDSNGQRVTISEENPNSIILVPQKFRDLEKEIIEYYNEKLLGYEINTNKLSKEIKIIWIENKQNFFSYQIDINPNQNNCVVDPLAMVITESNASKLNFLEVLGTGNFLMRVSNENTAINEINNELSKYYNIDEYSFPLTNIYDAMRERIVDSKNLIVSYSILLIVLIVLIGMIVIQNIVNYFEQNKQRLAIQKFMGFKLKEKYSAFLISYISSLVISICIAWVITKDVKIIAISIIIFIIEAIFTIIQLIINEKRNVLRLTKGG